MKLVEQDHIDGCGVACFAMLTGRTYKEAREVLHPGGGSYTANEALVEALQAHGYAIETRFMLPTIRDLHTSLLVVRYRIGGGMFMHSVVWDAEQQKVLDPFDERPFEEYENGLCLAFEITSGPSGPSFSASSAERPSG